MIDVIVINTSYFTHFEGLYNHPGLTIIHYSSHYAYLQCEFFKTER